jgi:hypothetical protein
MARISHTRNFPRFTRLGVPGVGENHALLKLTALFDMLTVALLVGGFLLLWLNLRQPKQDVLPAGTNLHSSAVQKIDLVAARSPRELATKAEEESEPGANREAVSDAAPVEVDAHSERASIVQNHYASSVSAAMAKSRRVPARV